MARRTLFDQLDDAVQAVLAKPDAPLPRVSARVAPLLRIAADLRGLPSEEFKALLKTDLQRRASMATQASAVKPIPEGFHTVTPYLIIPGAEKVIQFLKQAFGADKIFRVKKPDGSIMHANLRIEDSMLEMADAGGPILPRPSALHIYVRDADAAYEEALRAGGVSVYKPMDQPYGDREAGVKDPGGNIWFIATHKATGHAPEGLRAVTPYLLGQGTARLIDFLKEALGAEEAERAQSPDGAIVHAKVRIGDSMVEMGEARGEWPAMPCTMHVYVTDTDALYERAMRAGAVSLEAPMNKPYGDRSAGIIDPAGNYWYFATHIKDVHV